MDASGSVHHLVQNATILTTGVLLTERQLQILSSAFPHLAATCKLADRATGVAVTSSSNTMMNYLAQYTMDLPSRAEQTPAEFWRQRDNGSVIPLVALDLISAPASQAFVDRLFSVCGMLTTGTRNRMRKSLRMRSWLRFVICSSAVVENAVQLTDIHLLCSIDVLRWYEHEHYVCV